MSTTETAPNKHTPMMHRSKAFEFIGFSDV